MSRASFFQDVNWSAVTKNSAITKDIRLHLHGVYTTLALAILCAAAGSIVFLKTFIGGFGTFLIGFLLLIWLAMTPQQEVQKRVALLCGFAFVEGLSLGPIILQTLELDPSIVTTAFLGTTCIFICFSAVAYFAERRSYLFLGGLLSSALSIMLLFSFLNIFFRSLAIYNFQVYFGLLVFCGFVVFDTQLIIEKAAHGSKDFVWDSLNLFLDFVNIFVRLLIILSKDKKKKNSKR